MTVTRRILQGAFIFAVPLLLILSGGTAEGTADKDGTAGLTPPPPTLTISVGAGFQLSPCQGASCPGGKLRLPRTKTGWDFAGLRRALQTLRQQYPGKAPMLMVAPALAVRWWVVVKALDGARLDAAGKPLFPTVVLAREG